MGKIIVRVINLIQGTKFLPSINEYYAFLDSLTILEESCVFHIIIFMTLTFCVINIMGALFANELIKFFKLESRFPSLAIFFYLRLKFQRYYLIYSVSTMLFFSIVGLFMNLLILATG